MATLDLFSKLVAITTKSVILKSIMSQIRENHRKSMMDMINDISNIKFNPLEESIYLKPLRMTYKQNGKQKFWDLMEMHDSVAIMIYNITRQVFIFVKQFRPGVYFVEIPTQERFDNTDKLKYPPKLGITTELCAGIVDKNKSLAEIAREEVLEECGYDVPIDKFEQLQSFNANIGISGSVVSMFYCEVTDDMRVSPGGGVGSEIIDVIEMDWGEYEKYISQSRIRSPGSVLVAYYWFILNKPQHYNILKHKK